MKKPSVSIIIITYNRCGYLSRLLGQIQKQILIPDEVVIVDNNSQDATRDVIAQYVSKINIRYVFEKQQGVSFARNAGIKAAEGDIIVFIDDDCLPVDEHWLQELVKEFELDPKIGVIGGRTVPVPKDVKSWLELFCDNLTK